jgi:hypothetical protein
LLLEADALVAVRFVGAAGAPAGGAPRKSPERTALPPAFMLTVIVTDLPLETVMGKLVQAPWEKSVEMVAVWGPEPSSTVMVSRRTVESQSTA